MGPRSVVVGVLVGEGLKLVGSLVGKSAGRAMWEALSRFGGVDRWGGAAEARIATREWEVVG